MKLNVGKLLGAIINVAKANPSLVISAVTAIAPVVKAITSEAKKPRA
jgi:hypothetical protein